MPVHSFKTNKQQRKEGNQEKDKCSHPEFYNAQKTMRIWHLCNANSTSKGKQNTIK